MTLEETLSEVAAQIEKLDREYGLPLRSIRAGVNVMGGIMSGISKDASLSSVLPPMMRGVPVIPDPTLEGDEFALVYRARRVR